MSKNYELLRQIEKEIVSSEKPERTERPKTNTNLKYKNELAKLPSDVIEEYIGLKNALSIQNPRPKTLLFTSTLPKEGTSTVAAEFSASLTLKSQARVLLIDGNLRFPRIHKFLGLDNEKGFSDVILDYISLEQAIEKSKFENLHILTAGTTKKNVIPLQLFDTEKIISLIEEAKQKYDQIIIDTPAVNYYPDAMMLAPKCDGVVLVVQAGKTVKKSLLEANKRLHKAQANILGVVLNRYKERTPFRSGY